MTEAWLRDQLEQIHSRIRAEDRKQRAARREREIRDLVAAYLEEHPDASANAVAAAVPGRRREVLQAVKDARRSVPAPGNHHGADGQT